MRARGVAPRCVLLGATALGDQLGDPPAWSPAGPSSTHLPRFTAPSPLRSVTTFNTLLAAASDAGSYPALLEVGGRAGRGPRGAPAHGRSTPAPAHLTYAWPLRSPTRPPPAPQVGQALAGAEPDVKACCMNAYVAGLVKVSVAWWGVGWAATECRMVGWMQALARPPCANATLPTPRPPPAPRLPRWGAGTRRWPRFRACWGPAPQPAPPPPPSTQSCEGGGVRGACLGARLPRDLSLSGQPPTALPWLLLRCSALTPPTRCPRSRRRRTVHMKAGQVDQVRARGATHQLACMWQALPSQRPCPLAEPCRLPPASPTPPCAPISLTPSPPRLPVPPHPHRCAPCLMR